MLSRSVSPFLHQRNALLPRRLIIRTPYPRNLIISTSLSQVRCCMSASSPEPRQPRKGRGKDRDLNKPKACDTNNIPVYSITGDGCHSGLPERSKPYLVLGIESSCDDTGVAIVRSDGRILANIVRSQHAIHHKFGGIVPMLAMNAHKSSIEKALSEALREAGLKDVSEIDAIAVTRGPGLAVCLDVGYRKAMELAIKYKKPIAKIHHLEGHCTVARLAGEDIALRVNATDMDQPNEQSPPKSQSQSQSVAVGTNFTPKVDYPFLTFLASGGHTSLLLTTGLGQHTVLGGTLDDALGEAFDKAARILALPLETSGGVAVELAARRAEERRQKLRQARGKASRQLEELRKHLAERIGVPMRDRRDCIFSYSGLKTAFRLEVSKCRESRGLNGNATNAPPQSMIELNNSDLVQIPTEEADELCVAFQRAALTHVEDRVYRALELCRRLRIPITALVVVGGVAANQELRKRLGYLVQKRYAQQQYSKDASVRNSPLLRVVSPPPSLCTDNGVMIAWTGIEKFSKGLSDSYDDEFLETNQGSSTDDRTIAGAAVSTAAGSKRTAHGVTARWPIGDWVFEDDLDGEVVVYQSGRHIVRVSDIRAMLPTIENQKRNNPYLRGSKTKIEGESQA